MRIMLFGKNYIFTNTLKDYLKSANDVFTCMFVARAVLQYAAASFT